MSTQGLKINMKRGCGKFWDGLVALAHGEPSVEAAAHVQACEACASSLEELRSGLASLGSEFFDAPKEVRERAKAIFPRAVPVVARLASSTLSGAGARGGESFQAVYDFPDGQARVLYEPEGGKWRVMGSVDAEGYETEYKDDDPSRFEFVARNLAEAEVRLYGIGKEVILPAPDVERP